MKKFLLSFIIIGSLSNLCLNAAARACLHMLKDISDTVTTQTTVQPNFEYTLSAYNHKTIHRSDVESAELWRNPTIMANVGMFSVGAESQVLALRTIDNPAMIAACIQFRMVAGCGYISKLAVHPDHQRRGLAHRLMQETESLCHAHGCKKLKLSVYEDNASAIHCYMKSGFKRIHA